MRNLKLSKSGFNKIRSNQLELKSSDFETSLKSITPGEWCIAVANENESWLCFVNPLIEDKFTCSYLVTPLSQIESQSTDVATFIEEKITIAINKRKRFKDYSQGRLFYGSSDGLPGLIIDDFENATIIQINTAGVDFYRQKIKSFVENFLKKPVYFLDNPKYREKESLPTFSEPELPDIYVSENGLKFKIRKEVLQKVGFYFDHRENRAQLMGMLQRLTLKPLRAADLFCYAGAWGISALKGGLKSVDFVDQGDLGAEVLSSLEMNGLSDRGLFIRSDVFKFLDDKIKNNETYDLILCDPPAFTKNALQKSQALEGYSKLHRKVFKLLSKNSIAAFSSCTHYVGHSEFERNILEASRKENRKIQMIYSGIQGFDHPITSLEDRSNYIKSYFYIVE